MICDCRSPYHGYPKRFPPCEGWKGIQIKKPGSGGIKFIKLTGDLTNSYFCRCFANHTLALGHFSKGKLKEIRCIPIDPKTTEDKLKKIEIQLSVINERIRDREFNELRDAQEELVQQKKELQNDKMIDDLSQKLKDDLKNYLINEEKWNDLSANLEDVPQLDNNKEMKYEDNSSEDWNEISESIHKFRKKAPWQKRSRDLGDLKRSIRKE